MTDRKLTETMKARTKKYGLRIIKLFRALPKNDEARLIGRQLFRAGTSVAANYRAVCRARSKADFISKLGIVVEETDESLFWMELLVEAEIVKESKLSLLMKEGNELLAIFAASQITVRGFRNDK